VEEDVMRVIEEVKVLGKVLGAFNSTFLALIPKKDKPIYFDYFMPISLCNNVYKIISNILAIRINKIFFRYISQEQFGFLVARHIFDVIGVAQEEMHSFKTKELPSMVLKLDLSKDYNIMSWLYLRSILLHVGFNYLVVSWILGCISYISLATLINGSNSSFFKPSRGFKKGCPLFPLLLLTIIEGLIRTIMDAKIIGLIIGPQDK
jgi:hypothetical protein